MRTKLDGTSAPKTEKFIQWCVKKVQARLAKHPDWDSFDTVYDVVLDSIGTVDGWDLLDMARELQISISDLTDAYEDLDNDYDYGSAFIYACSEFCVPEVQRRVEELESSEEEARHHEQVLGSRRSPRRR